MTSATDTNDRAPASFNDQIWYGAAAAPPPGLTVTDYARKIHWWVRLFGVVWLASIAFAVAVGVFIGIAAAAQSRDAGSSYTPTYTPTSSMTYSECMANPNTTFAQCQLLR